MITPDRVHVNEFNANRPKEASLDEALSRLRDHKLVYAALLGQEVKLVILESEVELTTLKIPVLCFYQSYTPKIPSLRSDDWT